MSMSLGISNSGKVCSEIWPIIAAQLIIILYCTTTRCHTPPHPDPLFGQNPVEVRQERVQEDTVKHHDPQKPGRKRWEKKE